MSIEERGGGRAHERTDSRTEGRAHEYYSRLSRLQDGLRRSKGGGVEVADRPSWAVERSCRSREKVSRGSGRSRDRGSEG